MGQTMFCLLGPLIPGIAEGDVDSFHFVLRRKEAVDIFDIEIAQKKIVHLAHASVCFLRVSLGDAQNGRLTLSSRGAM